MLVLLGYPDSAWWALWNYTWKPSPSMFLGRPVSICLNTGPLFMERKGIVNPSACTQGPFSQPHTDKGHCDRWTEEKGECMQKGGCARISVHVARVKMRFSIRENEIILCQARQQWYSNMISNQVACGVQAECAIGDDHTSAAVVWPTQPYTRCRASHGWRMQGRSTWYPWRSIMELVPCI